MVTSPPSKVVPAWIGCRFSSKTSNFCPTVLNILGSCLRSRFVREKSGSALLQKTSSSWQVVAGGIGKCGPVIPHKTIQVVAMGVAEKGGGDGPRVSSADLERKDVGAASKSRDLRVCFSGL